MQAETLILPRLDAAPPSRLKLVLLDEERGTSASVVVPNDLFPLVCKVAEIHLAAIVRIQAHIRGTLARWNVRVLKLEQKLEAIQQLKEKQLKKIEQRRRFKLQDAYMEYEMRSPQRALLRRVEKAINIRYHFKELVEREERASKRLSQQCQLVRQQNRDLAEMITFAVQQSALLKDKVQEREAEQEQLQKKCNGLLQDVEMLQAALKQSQVQVSTSKSSPPPASKRGLFGWLSFAPLHQISDKGISYVTSR